MYTTYTMYMGTTEPLNITEARKRLAAIIDQAHADHEPVYLTRHGRRVAAVIDADTGYSVGCASLDLNTLGLRVSAGALQD